MPIIFIPRFFKPRFPIALSLKAPALLSGNYCNTARPIFAMTGGRLNGNRRTLLSRVTAKTSPKR